MKWFVIACFLLWARHGEGGALKCATESGDAGCPSEIQEIESKQSDPETSASTLEPWEPECLPGSEWESNCYSCHCWPEGAALCRRQSSCNSPDTEPMRCKPNTAFKRECNTCYCGADGYARCTDMFCGKVSDPETPASTLDPMEMECLPGSEWESNCHSCRCSPEGAALCRRQSSCNSPDTEPMRCKPKTAFKRECNTCYCGADGYARCTDIFCGKVSDLESPAPRLEPSEAECLPGSEWESNCHSCRCSPEGAAVCRRQNSCDSPYTEPILCKPNTTFERECNTCNCLDNGHVLCTLMFCVKMPARAPSKEALPKGQDCAPGSEWTSGCNDCKCSPEGLRICSSLRCSEGQETEPLLRCAPHSLWMKECNTCWCTSDGRAMCTRIGCVGIPSDMHFSEEQNEPDSLGSVEPNETLMRKVRAVPQESPKTCQPGQEFRMDCNKCLCDNEGQDFSCTRIDCNALNNNNKGGTRRRRDVTHKVPADCVPGSVFDQGCNVCRCTEDGGHATCTLKRCPNKEDNKVSTTESSFRCNPGEQFKQSCNDCSCSADGKSVFCTLFICDEDLTP